MRKRDPLPPKTTPNWALPIIGTAGLITEICPLCRSPLLAHMFLPDDTIHDTFCSNCQFSESWLHLPVTPDDFTITWILNHTNIDYDTYMTAVNQPYIARRQLRSLLQRPPFTT